MNNQLNLASIKFQRPGFWGVLLSIKINLDGYVYELKGKEPLILQIVPGIHNIVIDTPKTFGIPHQDNITINAVAGDYYIVDLKADLLLGGFKINNKTSKLV